MNGAMAFGVVMSLVDRLTAPLKGATKQLDLFGATMKKVDAVTNKGVRMDAIDKMKDWGRQTREAGNKTMAVGGIMTGVGVEMRHLAGDFMAPFDEFERSLSFVRTVAPGTFGSVAADMTALKKTAVDWSMAHTDSATDFVRANYMMISSGLDMRAAMAGTATAMTVAKATNGNAMEAASVLATVYSNMGNKTAEVTGEMSRLGDVMTRTQQLFKFANLGQLNEGLKYGVPVAKQYGMEMEQLSAVIGTLNDVGLEGGMAGTSLMASMRNINKAAKDLHFTIARTSSGGVDMIETIANIQKAYGDKMGLPKIQQAFQLAFGDEGVKGITLLMGKVERMRGAMGDLANSTGAAAAAQKIMESDGKAGWEKLKNALDALKITVGEGLGPMLAGLADRMRGLVLAMRSLFSAHPWIAKVGASFFLLAAGITSIFGPAALAVGSLQKFGGAVGGVYAWMKKAKLATELAQAGQSMKGVSIGARAMGKAIAWAIGTALPWLWSMNAALLANPITWIVAAVLALAAGIALLTVYWEEWTTWLEKQAWWVKVLAVNFALAMGPVMWLALAANWVIRNWDQVGAAFASAWQWMSDTFWAVAQPIINAVTWLADKIVWVLQKMGLIQGQAGAALGGGAGGGESWTDKALGYGKAAIGAGWKIGNMPTYLASLALDGVAGTNTARWTGGPTDWFDSGKSSPMAMPTPEAPVGVPASGKQQNFFGGVNVNFPAEAAKDRESFTRMLSGVADQHG